MVEITLLLCDLKQKGEQGDWESVMNKIEVALASETEQNEKLKKQLAELKDSQKRLEEQTKVFEKKKAELKVLRDESYRKQEEI